MSSKQRGYGRVVSASTCSVLWSLWDLASAGWQTSKSQLMRGKAISALQINWERLVPKKSSKSFRTSLFNSSHVCVCVCCVCCVCLLCVSAVCVCCVCLLCVSAVCVCCVCLLCVSAVCVCCVCLLCVSAVCVCCVCLLCVSAVCVCCVCLLCVSAVCVCCVCLLCVSAACVCCVCLLCVSAVCVCCVCLLCVSAVCVCCVCLLCVSAVCVCCVCLLCVSAVCVKLAVMLPSCVDPSFPSQLAESHDHQLYHVAIVSSAGIRHVLCTAQGEFPQAPRAVFQARCTSSSSGHTAGSWSNSPQYTQNRWLSEHPHKTCTRRIVWRRQPHSPTASSRALSLQTRHVSDITRCSATQCKTCPSESLPVHDSSKSATNASARYCSVSQPWTRTLTRSNLSTTPLHKQVVPTKVFSNTRKFDSPFIQKPTSQSRRNCAPTNCTERKTSEKTRDLHSSWKIVFVHWFEIMQKHHTSEDTIQQNTPSLNVGVNVHFPQRQQRVLHWHQPCRASTLTLLTFKTLLRCATPVNSTKNGTSGARPSGSRQQKHSMAKKSWIPQCRSTLQCQTVQAKPPEKQKIPRIFISWDLLLFMYFCSFNTELPCGWHDNTNCSVHQSFVVQHARIEIRVICAFFCCPFCHYPFYNCMALHHVFHLSQGLDRLEQWIQLCFVIMRKLFCCIEVIFIFLGILFSRV